MEVTVAAFDLVARVVGAVRPDLTAVLLDGPARERLVEALAGSFGGDEVIIVRELRCRAVVVLGQPFADHVLPEAIARAVARIVRDHPFDDDLVARFPDTPAYLAAYLHDIRDGHGDRWYYAPLARFRRPDGTADWERLLTEHHCARWQFLARADGLGDLEALLTALGPAVLTDILAPAPGSASLAATAISLVRATGAEPRPVAGLRDVAVPDWRDPSSLGSALGVMVRQLLGGSGVEPAAVLREAGRFDWFDQGAFAVGLGFVPAGLAGPSAAIADARPADELSQTSELSMAVELSREAGSAGPAGVAGVAGAILESGVDRDGVGSPGSQALGAVLSPRTRQVVGDLYAVVDGDPRLWLDPGDAAGAANVVRLVAALIRHSPRWRDDEHARSVVAHVLRVWNGPPALPDRFSIVETGEKQSLVVLAYKMGLRFGRERTVSYAPGVSGAGLLLFRTMNALGLGTALLSPIGASGEPLLAALLRAWTGVGAQRDPLLELVELLSRARSTRCDVGVVARRMVGQRLVVGPFRVVALPDGLVAVAGADDRVLPLLARDVSTLERSLLDLGESGLEREPADPAEGAAANAGDAVIAGALEAVGAEDPQVGLFAVGCVQAWARWLPGFATASVPFLLERFVRRPAEVAVGDGAIEVRLSPRPHDVVLSLAGYLEPITFLDGRELRFVIA
ncbi:hypothetical protein ACQP2E_12295 [Actinoplanes sp. CA-015351]|uniref:hypothetical protein n=1 Tax=Actinoplanes sp. CA-015351 TaxID=3239897 RepID=UPI003D951F54